MQNSKKIFGLLTQDAKRKLTEMLKNKEDISKIRKYLDMLETAKKKVEASVNIPTTSIKQDDYEWLRFNGKIAKPLYYAGMLIRLEPKTVLGIAKIGDSLGNQKIVIPSFKKTPISIKQEIVSKIKAKCNPYTGKIESLFSPKKAIAKVDNISDLLKEYSTDITSITKKAFYPLFKFFDVSSVRDEVNFYKTLGHFIIADIKNNPATGFMAILPCKLGDSGVIEFKVNGKLKAEFYIQLPNTPLEKSKSVLEDLENLSKISQKDFEDTLKKARKDFENVLKVWEEE